MASDLVFTKLFILCYIKIYQSVSHFDWIFYLWFCNIMHWFFWKYWGFFGLCWSSKCTQNSLYNNKKLYLLIALPRGKSLSTRKLPRSWWQRQVFQNSNLCLKVQFYPRNAISCFLLNVHFVQFWGNVCQITKTESLTMCSNQTLKWPPLSPSPGVHVLHNSHPFV